MTAARERRILIRDSEEYGRIESKALILAAIKISNLKAALFKANDQGEDSWIRASGDVKCPVCGDLYYDHETIEGFDWLHGICTGLRVKL